MSVSCAVSNSVRLSGGGEVSIAFSCDSYNPSSTTPVGTFSLFGNEIAVNCADWRRARRGTFSGALSVADEWA